MTTRIWRRLRDDENCSDFITRMKGRQLASPGVSGAVHGTHIDYLHTYPVYNMHSCCCMIYVLFLSPYAVKWLPRLKQMWYFDSGSGTQKSANVGFAPKNHAFSTTNLYLGTVGHSRRYVETVCWYWSLLRSPRTEQQMLAEVQVEIPIIMNFDFRVKIMFRRAFHAATSSKWAETLFPSTFICKYFILKVSLHRSVFPTERKNFPWPWKWKP